MKAELLFPASISVRKPGGNSTELQYLRAFAVFFVIVMHAPLLCLPYPAGWVRDIQDWIHPAVGVDLFFVISGFLMGKSFVDRYRAHDSADGRMGEIASFWIRRYYRLLPASVFWLAVTFAMSLVSDKHDLWLTPNVMFVKALSALAAVRNFQEYPAPSYFGYYWSLSVENQFYVVLPIVLLIFPARLRVPGLMVSCGLNAFWRPGGANWWLFRYDGLLWGLMLYALDASGLARPFVRLLPATTTGRVIFMVFSGSFLLVSPLMLPDFHPFAWTLVNLGGFALVFAASRNQGTILVPPGGRSVMLWLGARSYSLYLCHIPIWFVVIDISQRTGVASQSAVPGRAAIALACCLVAADATYRFIELPLQLRGRIRSKAAAPATSMGGKQAGMPITNASTQHPAGWSLLQWLIGHQVSLSILALCLWTAETAWRLPGDACYDLLNYHLYGPYSIFHGVWQRNIVPAQSQGFLSPLNDFYFYLLATRVEHVHTLNVLLALPEMVALSIGLVVTLHLLNAQSVVERLVALIAVLIGATGAATHPVLATSMSDMLPCGFALGCILLLMKNAQRTIDGKIHSAWADLVPGLLMGAAIGLKLTFAFTAVALIAAVFAWSGVYELIRARMAVVFCAGIALGILVSAGWWWMNVWQMTGSPIFPLYNTVFSSPMAGPFDYIDTRFLPHDASHLAFNVFRWAISSKPIVTEADVPMRDPRMALALTASFMSLAIGVVRPSHDTDRTRFLAVFFVMAFVLWERQFSIFRYLSLLELLSGTMMATFGFSLLRGPAGRRAMLAGGMLLLIVLKAYTIYPNWGRQAEPGGRFIQVNMPTLPPASLVLILDAAPLSYLAVLEPESVVFAGTNNNVTRPGDGGIFQRRISAAISGHAEQLFGLEKPDFDPGTADRTLNFYHLRRDDCTPVIGNIVGTTTMLCHLSQGHG